MIPDSAEDSKLAELERLLNDPEVPMDARRVWQLVAELRFATRPKGTNLSIRPCEGAAGPAGPPGPSARVRSVSGQGLPSQRAIPPVRLARETGRERSSTRAALARGRWLPRPYRRQSRIDRSSCCDTWRPIRTAANAWAPNWYRRHARQQHRPRRVRKVGVRPFAALAAAIGGREALSRSASCCLTFSLRRS